MYHTKDKTYRLGLQVALILVLLLSGCSAGVKTLSIFKKEVPEKN